MELQPVTADQIVPTFEQVPWAELLRQMEGKPESEIHFSPSLEIENKQIRCGITISVCGSPADYEFYIFYKRPKLVSRFFGLSSTLDPEYLTDITGQTWADALQCLQALRDGDYDFLERKIR